MKLNLFTSTITLISILALVLVPAVAAKGKETAGYQTGFVRWRGASRYDNFSSWSLSDVLLNESGALALDWANANEGSAPYPPGEYNGRNYYNDGAPFRVGEATSLEITTPFDYEEAIASWNASTPAGSWVEVQFRAKYGGTRWSKWYVLGIWAADYSTIERHSVRLQGDSDGFVAVDTFVSSNKKETTSAFQLKILLFSEDGTAIPSVRNASVAYSTSPPKSVVVPPNDNPLWNTELDVPQCSQMVYPGEGGEVWCSPTSTSMVMGYWGYMPDDCEPRVRDAVEGVYDWIYDGHGNWPFNTAYAAAHGYEGYVARFSSLAKAEEFIAAGVPVIMSIAWGKGELTGSDIESTNGHLLVLVGFDASGNPIVNDPASPEDGAPVRHVYLRSEFEPLWLQASGGTVYLIYPASMAADVPPIP
ncbi:MAG TPA: peptidase C39 family protein [Anaerolineales bacterium]|nr:peptidase C39 family protein [Anaerolineales bacterium]